MSVRFRLRFNKTSLKGVPSPAPGQRATYYDTEVPGLQLRVTDCGVKSFCVFRRSKRGRPKRVTIGRFPTLSVEHVWVKARRHLGDLDEGINVSARLRNEALEGKIFCEIHQEYLAGRGVTVLLVNRKDGEHVGR